jgi:uncharacterized membrane protein
VQKSENSLFPHPKDMITIPKNMIDIRGFMKKLILIEKTCLHLHIGLTIVGIVAIALILPHKDWLNHQPEFRQTLFNWGLENQFGIQIILQAIAVIIYAYRYLGMWHLFTFMIPAMFLALSSEMLSVVTGFPFGYYSYPHDVNLGYAIIGLGYKVLGLVPWTIAFWWFSMGLSCYVIARASLEKFDIPRWLIQIASVMMGAIMLTAWDIVFEPTMAHSNVRFWIWQDQGAFLGIPYPSFAAWLVIASLFMGIAALCWQKDKLYLVRSQLILPLIIYLTNFIFAVFLGITTQLWIPIILGLIFGLIPMIFLWWKAENISCLSSEFS